MAVGLAYRICRVQDTLRDMERSWRAEGARKGFLTTMTSKRRYAEKNYVYIGINMGDLQMEGMTYLDWKAHLKKIQAEYHQELQYEAYNKAAQEKEARKARNPDATNPYKPATNIQ